jgi:hypothetical protein
MKKMILLGVMLYSLHIINAQTNANIEVTSNHIDISAPESINISTGTNGKTYYNNREIATKNDLSRSATVVIAASNASSKSKEGADYVCTGDGDNVIISQAIANLPVSGGKILLTEGTFNISGNIFVNRDNVQVSGFGMATCIKSYGIVFFKTTGNNLTFSDMMLDGLEQNTQIGFREDYNLGLVLRNMTIKDCRADRVAVIRHNTFLVDNIRLINSGSMGFLGAKNGVISNVYSSNSVGMVNNLLVHIYDACENITLNNINSKTGTITIANPAKSIIISNSIAKSMNITGSYTIVTGCFTVNGITNTGSNNHISNNYLIPAQ